MIKKSNKAVLLLSGGLDSAVVLSICKKLGYEIDAITFDYNQRHKVELNCAKWQADNFKCVSHRIFKLDFFGGSSLTDNIDVPKNENITNIDVDLIRRPEGPNWPTVPSHPKFANLQAAQHLCMLRKLELLSIPALLVREKRTHNSDQGHLGPIRIMQGGHRS